MTSAAAVLLALVVTIFFAAIFAFGAAPTVNQSGATTNNNLLVFSTNGGEFSVSSAVFRGAVQVVEPQMYMECELLTVFFQTNSQSREAVGGMTNLNARIEIIIAETNLLMMARDTAIIGDRAVYTASNETVVVTGELVVIETEKSYTYGEHFVFDRRSGKGHAVGWNVTELKMEGTNSLKTSLGPFRKPPPGSGGKPDSEK